MGIGGARPIDVASIQAKFADELETLLTWEKYLRRQIENRFSSLPPCTLEEPKGDCLPRSKVARMELLRGELLTEEDDPLLQLLVDFCAEVIFAGSIGASSDQISSYRLREELGKRIVPVTAVASGSATKRAVVAGTVQSLKPKPGRESSW